MLDFCDNADSPLLPYTSRPTQCSKTKRDRPCTGLHNGTPGGFFSTGVSIGQGTCNSFKGRTDQYLDCLWPPQLRLGHFRTFFDDAGAAFMPVFVARRMTANHLS